jgi:hypothetical protein
MALSKIQSESVNLADNFAFTGTVSGAGATTKLATVSSTSSVSSIEISTDYSAHINFRLILNIVGDNSSTSNGILRWKRSGQSSFDTSAIYGAQGSILDADNSHLNENATATHLYFVNSQPPNRGFQIDMWLGGLGSTIAGNAMHCFTTMTGLQASVASFAMGGSYDNSTNAKEKVTDLQLAFSNGSISEINYTLYGMN